MSSEVIKGAIRKMAKPGGYDAVMDRAIVTAVDKNEVSCTVQLVADDSIIEGVKLKPVINDGDTSQLGLILYPALNSFVIVGQIDDDNTDLYILGMTVIDTIALDTATALKLLITSEGELSLNAVKMTFNGGKNNGIPLVKPLTTAINKLQNKLNTLIDAFNSHTHPGVKAGTDVSAKTVSSAPSKIKPITKVTDLANKNILQ